MERFWLDVRLAVRLWARTPGFSLVAIATIGLGVGASTALVGQVKAVFWTPLPVQQPQDLRIVAWTSPRHPFVIGPNVMAGPRVNGADTFGTVSYPAYLAMRDEADRVLRRRLLGRPRRGAAGHSRRAGLARCNSCRATTSARSACGPRSDGRSSRRMSARQLVAGRDDQPSILAADVRRRHATSPAGRCA